MKSWALVFCSFFTLCIALPHTSFLVPITWFLSPNPRSFPTKPSRFRPKTSPSRDHVIAGWLAVRYIY